MAVFVEPTLITVFSAAYECDIAGCESNIVIMGWDEDEPDSIDLAEQAKDLGFSYDDEGRLVCEDHKNA